MGCACPHPAAERRECRCERAAASRSRRALGRPGERFDYTAPLSQWRASQPRQHPATIIRRSMIGQRLLHYEIVEVLGQGGMGTVYQARDTHLNRLVARKVFARDRILDVDK